MIWAREEEEETEGNTQAGKYKEGILVRKNNKKKIYTEKQLNNKVNEERKAARSGAIIPRYKNYS